MEALQAGSMAPEFTLSLIDGSIFSLAQARRRGPVLLAFFKVSCPVCQYSMPFLERIHQAYGGRKFTLVGISQNSRRETEIFERQFAFTFPVALDAPQFAVSNAYGLTTVPTFFCIAPDGTIEISSAGWVKSEIAALNAKLAAGLKTAPATIFLPGEQVAEWRPG
jgi:peroxiredoxin